MNILEKIDKYLEEEYKAGSAVGENPNAKFKVYRSGGSIGGHPKGKTNKKGDLFIKGFESKEDAKDFIKTRNKKLSPGEKGYYGLKYYMETK